MNAPKMVAMEIVSVGGYPVPRPVKWELVKADFQSGTMGIYVELREQRDGRELYAVRETSFVLTTDNEWEYEPIPSSRDDDFIARARFASFDEAVTAFRRSRKGRPLSVRADGGEK